MKKIAIAVYWRGMSLSEKSDACANAVTEPMLGQVQESALYHLCREAFYSPNGHPNKEAEIKASMLRERLSSAIEIILKDIEMSGDSIEQLEALVALCERKERELGKPCTLNMFFKLY